MYLIMSSEVDQEDEGEKREKSHKSCMVYIIRMILDSVYYNGRRDTMGKNESFSVSRMLLEVSRFVDGGVGVI